jgi:glutamate formiminotransferase/formiminotetrahydrofolate cyclodeaminase
MKLVECVPNFSEGRRPEVIAAIRDAIASVQGVAVLDVSSDPSHNRTVVTFVAPVESAVEAALAGMREATARIDLNVHRGEHPRIGATDVVPFVPLEGSTMEDCILLARSLGERAARELGIPIYLYERAATRPDRVNLADVRRGEFEGLRDDIRVNPNRAPDFGPRELHPTAGATAVGARPFLVAFNVYLGPASNLPVAQEVAKAVRHSSGGLRYVKALALEVDGQAQVSMNLTDLEGTPLHRAYDLVRTEAAAHGVLPTWSEIVGLVPERALLEAGARHVQLRGFSPQMLLERRVREAVSGGPTLGGFLAQVAAPTAAPGGGSVAALAGALAAALVQMVAGLTLGRRKYAAVEPEMRDTATRAAALSTRLLGLVEADARAYERVTEAQKLPKEPLDMAARRQEAIREALLAAARVPLETAEACAAVADLAAVVAAKGNRNAVSDAGVAAFLAEAGCRGAAYNVQINVSGMAESPEARELEAQARALVARASEAAQRAAAAVDLSLAAT